MSKKKAVQSWSGREGIGFGKFAIGYLSDKYESLKQGRPIQGDLSGEEANRFLPPFAISKSLYF